jgi:hypothetical protein
MITLMTHTITLVTLHPPLAAKELLNSDSPMKADDWVANYCSGKPTKTQSTN